MKKFIYSLFALAITAMTFTSCEDVPMPYGEPTNGGGTTTTYTGQGTVDDPYTVADANNYIKAGVGLDQTVYVKGIISVAPSFNATYGSLTYYISDDGTTTNQMQVYSGLDIGGARFTSASDLKLGQVVKVYGVIKDYNGKPEMDKNNTLISVTGEGTSTGGETGGGTGVPVSIDKTTVTMANSAATESSETTTVDLNTLGYADKAVVGTVTLNDGTTIVFDKSDGSSSPVFNTLTKGIRVYKNNTITINGKKAIAKVVFTCDSYSGTDYVGNATATVTFSGNNATYKNLFTESTSGVQLRVLAITITYAK